MTTTAVAMVAERGGAPVGLMRKRILIVDPDGAVGEGFAYLLTGYGYEPMVTRTVKTARALLARETFSALVTDLLPAGGRRWLAELRATHPDLPVLVVTTQGMESLGLDRVYGLADAVLPKPADPQVLVAVVNRIVNGRRGEP